MYNSYDPEVVKRDLDAVFKELASTEFVPSNKDYIIELLDDILLGIEILGNAQEKLSDEEIDELTKYVDAKYLEIQKYTNNIPEVL